MSSDDDNPLEKATDEVASRIDTIARTEASTAFEDEFDRQTTAMVSGAHDRRWFPVVVKVWDSTLDSKRCPICSAASLEVRPLGMSFTNGAPGHAHPRCRCKSVTFVLTVPFDRAIDEVDIE